MADFLEEIEVYFAVASIQVVHPTYKLEQKLQEFVLIVGKVKVFELF